MPFVELLDLQVVDDVCGMLKVMGYWWLMVLYWDSCP